MNVTQTSLHDPAAVVTAIRALAKSDAGLVLAFAAPAFFAALDDAARLLAASEQAPLLLGCSTAGEILASGVEENSCTLTAIHFEHTALRPAATVLHSMDDSQAAGERIGAALQGEDLRLVLLFAPGVNINGSALIAGLSRVIGEATPVFGGLAGDNGLFQQTHTLGIEGVSTDQVVAVGLYGKRLQLGHGSVGGWEAFGPERRITGSQGNILYSLDHEPALAIYKRYLGEYARDLPASGLLFPFALLGEDHHALGLIRTILGVDETNGSLILAGDVPEGGYLRLMHASTDALVNGAGQAAYAARSATPADPLALLVSCVGRKLAMGPRIEEEVEAVAEVFGQSATLAGFYSYGEINPFQPGQPCKLHNQTMTITTLNEC